MLYITWYVISSHYSHVYIVLRRHQCCYCFQAYVNMFFHSYFIINFMVCLSHVPFISRCQWQSSATFTSTETWLQRWQYWWGYTWNGYVENLPFNDFILKWCGLQHIRFLSLHFLVYWPLRNNGKMGSSLWDLLFICQELSENCIGNWLCVCSSCHSRYILQPWLGEWNRSTEVHISRFGSMARECYTTELMYNNN